MTTGRINQVTDRESRQGVWTSVVRNSTSHNPRVESESETRVSSSILAGEAAIAIGTTFQSVGVQSYYVRDEIVECRSRRTDIWPTILVPDRVASLQSPTSETACAAVKAPKVFAESRVSKTNLLSQLSDFSHLLYPM